MPKDVESLSGRKTEIGSRIIVASGHASIEELRRLAEKTKVPGEGTLQREEDTGEPIRKLLEEIRKMRGLQLLQTELLKKDWLSRFNISDGCKGGHKCSTV